jgi:hypothetical protein
LPPLESVERPYVQPLSLNRLSRRRPTRDRATRRDAEADPALANVTAIERKIVAMGGRLRAIATFENQPGGAAYAPARGAQCRSPACCSGRVGSRGEHRAFRAGRYWQLDRDGSGPGRWAIRCAAHAVLRSIAR